MKKSYQTPTSESISVESSGLIAVSVIPGGEADPGSEVMSNRKEWEDEGNPGTPFPWE